MNQEESPFQNRNVKSSEASGDPGDGGSLESFRTVDQERSGLEEEKRRLIELKKMVEAGKEKLRTEIEAFEQKKAAYGTGTPDREQQFELDKVKREWERIGAEEKRLQEERRKLDVLFDDTASRKTIIDREIKELERKRTQLDQKEFDLKEREEALSVKQQELRTERERWEEQRAKQLDELRTLPDRKAECEFELANLRLEKMRFEEEKKPLESERRYLEAKRKMMDQEQEILDQQKKIIEEQKKRLLKGGGLSAEEKYTLEKPIPTVSKAVMGPSAPLPSTAPSQFEASHDHLRQTEFSKKEAELERIRFERQKHRETDRKPVLKAIRPGKSVGKAIRVGKLPGEKEAVIHPTMTCISCNSEVPIPPGSTNVMCPKCGREYRIRSGAKKKTPRVGKLIQETPESTGDQPREHPQPRPGSLPSGISTPDDDSSSSPREEATIYERQGRYFIHCLNPSCKSEIELSNASKKRIHCPECGRRNKIVPLEG